MDVLDRRWKVRRRWLPWKRRIRRLPKAPGPANVGLGNDPVSGIAGLVVAILALPAIVVAGLLLVELLLLLVLLPVVALLRILLPVPWTIEVWWRPRHAGFWGWIEEYEEPVSGWAASRERIAQLRAATDELRRGDRFVAPDAGSIPPG